VKSIGNQITLPRDYDNLDEIKVVILELAEQICYRARMINCAGKTVSLTLRDHFLVCKTHALTLGEPSNITNEIYRAGITLLKKNWFSNSKARMVGLTISNLTTAGGRQLSMVSDVVRQEKLDQTCDEIKQRWGYAAIRRAASLTPWGVYYDRKKDR
jgi:DNA polymerase-4